MLDDGSYEQLSKQIQDLTEFVERRAQLAVSEAIAYATNGEHVRAIVEQRTQLAVADMTAYTDEKFGSWVKAAQSTDWNLAAFLGRVTLSDKAPVAPLSFPLPQTSNEPAEGGVEISRSALTRRRLMDGLAWRRN